MEIWNRVEKEDVNYMIKQNIAGEGYWHLVNWNVAQAIKPGRPTISREHLEEIRRCLGPGTTEWNREEDENLTSRFSPFDTAKYHA